jgi:uncharacterized protein YndB with AHSA1/START domain
MRNPTKVERRSDREVVATRTIHGPARLVFEAWTKSDVFRRWWVPKSVPITLVDCRLDVRVGGSYRLVFTHAGGTAEFFGRYLEVTPHSRLVFTNDEAGDAGAVTTVTFDERGGETVVAVSNVFPSKEALDAEMASGGTNALPETLDQLDALVTALRTTS